MYKDECSSRKLASGDFFSNTTPFSVSRDSGCSRMPFQIMDHRGVSASSHFFEDVSFRSEVFIVILVSCELLQKCDPNNLMIIRSVISHFLKMLFIFSLTFNAIAFMNRWFSKLVFWAEECWITETDIH